MVAAMDGPARLPALWAAACGCVQSHRDDEVIVVSFDEMRDAALGDGEGNVHASHDGEGGSDHHRPEAIHRYPRKVSKNPNRGNPNPTFDLARFVDAQGAAYPQALQELQAGHKRSHWMWFIFPQVAGLGLSTMAQRYAISGLNEAQAYLQHAVLGERLRVCTAAVNAVTGRTARQVFGSPDDMKFRSSMTLFGRAAPAEPAFRAALERYFDGQKDPRTLEKLQTR